MTMLDSQNSKDLKQTKSFSIEYKKRKKSIIVAYYFCLLMSGFGLHKFYLGNKTQAIKFAALYWIGLLVFAAGFSLMEMGFFAIGASSFVMGIATLAVFGIWWITDILTLYLQTQRKNELIKEELLATYPQK